MKDTNVKRKVLVAGIMIGIGLMAIIDEIIFHQLLQWHHFFDFRTNAFGVFSDGLLNSFALFSIVAGGFLIIYIAKFFKFQTMRLVAGLLIGLGSFQLFDGIVSHKVLGIHQIRYGVNLLPYDIIWNLVALSLIVAGFILLYLVNKRYAY